MITALAGGVGAARFLSGLAKLIPNEELTVITNTADDIELFGLHISPDLDIIAYTLAGIVDEEKGWGIKEDTFNCLNKLNKLGYDTWFNIGDKDLATHIYRTNRINQGTPLSQITNELCQMLGIKIRILPMTNEKFYTNIKTQSGIMHFEEYYVRKQAKDEVLDVEFIGVKTAVPAPGVIEAIQESQLIIVCPSNPIVSIGAILSVNGIREALKHTNAKIIGISPIVADAPIKGPADKLMRGLGFEVSAYGVAKLYADFLDIMLIDNLDAPLMGRIEKLGIQVKMTKTVMKTIEDKIALANEVLNL